MAQIEPATMLIEKGDYSGYEFWLQEAARGNNVIAKEFLASYYAGGGGDKPLRQTVYWVLRYNLAFLWERRFRQEGAPEDWDMLLPP